MLQRNSFLVASALVLLLLYNDARQKPIGPAYSYGRRGLNEVALAGGDAAKLQTAFETLFEALRMDERDPVAHFAMGWGLQQRGWGAEAIGHYEKAITELAELSKYSHFNLGLLLEQRGERAEALVRYREALRLDPAFEPALRKLGELQ